MDAIGFGQHNHAECISNGLDLVASQCRAAGLKFTPVRRRVLEMLLAEHRAHGAYEILDRPDIDPPLSINEYVAISEAFFGGTQPTFVNGALDRLARETAGDEQG